MPPRKTTRPAGNAKVKSAPKTKAEPPNTSIIPPDADDGGAAQERVDAVLDAIAAKGPPPVETGSVDAGSTDAGLVGENQRETAPPADTANDGDASNSTDASDDAKQTAEHAGDAAAYRLQTPPEPGIAEPDWFKGAIEQATKLRTLPVMHAVDGAMMVQSFGRPSSKDVYDNHFDIVFAPSNEVRRLQQVISLIDFVRSNPVATGETVFIQASLWRLHDGKSGDWPKLPLSTRLAYQTLVALLRTFWRAQDAYTAEREALEAQKAAEKEREPLPADETTLELVDEPFGLTDIGKTTLAAEGTISDAAAADDHAAPAQ